jgi:sugar O-acyltransferase (sialic acid O-acetyltransferase NeuD family)
VADVVRAAGKYEIAGLVDSFQPAGTRWFDHEVLGGEADLPALCARLNVNVLFVAIGDNFQRAAMTGRIRAVLPGIRFATLVYPSAVVGSDVQLGEGAVLMPGVVVVGGSVIGEGCVLNTSCSLDHDCVMEDWSSLGPGVVAGGNVRLGARSFAGLGARIIQRVTVGSDTIIGAGSLVLHDLPASVVAYGSPSRVVRERLPDEAHL